MTYLKKPIIIIASILLTTFSQLGCISKEASFNNEPSTNIPQELLPFTHSYDKVTGGGNLYRMVSACELFSWEGPIGVFEFTDIIGSMKKDKDGIEGPWIQVTAKLEKLLLGSINHEFTFSFSGGLNPQGKFLSPDLSAQKGERVVMLIHEPGLVVDTELQIFREIEPGYFSNGQLFAEKGISVSEIYKIASEIRNNEDCPFESDFGFNIDSDHGFGDLEEGEAIILEDDK